MDKPEFCEKAPFYYALAIARLLIEDEDIRSKDDMTISYIEEGDGPASDGYCYILNDVLFAEAIELLRNWGVVAVIEDDFSPQFYRRTRNFPRWWENDAPKDIPLFGKFHQLGRGGPRWLKSALVGVNDLYAKLGVKAEDFTAARQGTQWEPIPLERSDEKLRKASEALDEAVEKIEADNGYAVAAPGEREYVLTNLKHVAKILKEQSQVYWMQIKTFALEPLGRVIQRFGPSAVGVVARAARDALTDWLKETFSDWLS